MEKTSNLSRSRNDTASLSQFLPLADWRADTVPARTARRADPGEQPPTGSSSACRYIPQKLLSKKNNAPQLPETIRREMVPFDPKTADQKQPSPAPASAKPETTPQMPVLTVVAETPPAATKEVKKFSNDFAPFGRLIPCELVITVDSSSIQTPIIGLVTEDIFHHGQLIIPAGTEVHGTAQVDRARERIASNGRWTLVWQNGQELNVSGLALDHEREPETGSWGITDGSAGLRGKLLKTDNLAEVKLYVAALLSGAARSIHRQGDHRVWKLCVAEPAKCTAERRASRARSLRAADS